MSQLRLDFIYIQTYKQRVQAYLAAGAHPDLEQNEVSFIAFWESVQYLGYNCIIVVARVLYLHGSLG